MKNVIIVGAGIGGLATALRLLKQGYAVTIFEKEKTVGGKVNQFHKAGYTFDLTATISMMPQDFYQLFKDLDVNIEDYLHVMASSELYEVFYRDGSTYHFSTDLKQLSCQLEEISTEDAVGYYALMSDVYRKYQLANQKFLSQSCDQISDFFTPTHLMEALKLEPMKSVYDYVSKYIKDEHLRQYICFQAMYIGMSPYDSSSIYTLLSGVAQFYGFPYLKGGMYSLVKAMECLVYEFGGHLLTNMEVSELVLDAERVVGVRCLNGVYRADLIIANAEVPYVFSELQSLVKPKKYHLSCSTFILYLGIKKKLPMFNIHNLWIDQKFKENITAPFDGTLPTEPSFYFYVPSRIDEQMAPRNCEVMNVMVRVPNLLANEVEWNEKMIQKLKDKIYEALKQMTGMDNFCELIEVEHCLTPVDLKTHFNSYEGMAFGLSHDLNQTNYFRPHHQCKELEGLYFVGACTHPGTGISLVLKSATQLCEHILKN